MWLATGGLAWVSLSIGTLWPQYQGQAFTFSGAGYSLRDSVYTVAGDQGCDTDAGLITATRATERLTSVRYHATSPPPFLTDPPDHG